MRQKRSPIEELLAVMAQLRDPQHGCPWDLRQTFRSIVPFTLEEAYEVAEAIEHDDLDALRGELGDLLFQVVFYAQMAKEQGAFDFNDVATAIVEKMRRRHPHVFGDTVFGSEEAHKANWEALKAEERQAKAASEEPLSVLDGIATTLPGLTRAVKLQKRAARVGFDWRNLGEVVEKAEEELEEIRAELAEADQARLTDEIGDLLFVATNLARFAKIDPEQAMRHANRKFERRFRRMESLAGEQGRRLDEMSIEEQEALWQQAKREERS